MNNFPHGMCKNLCESCEKACEKVSTVLTRLADDYVVLWESRGCGKVMHGFSMMIYTRFWGSSSPLGGEISTVST